MSDLQLSLIVLAVIAIVAVWLFNVLVERRRRKLFEQRLKPRPGAAVPDGIVLPRVQLDPVARTEPTLGDDEPAAAVEPSPPDDVAVVADATADAVVDDHIHAVVTLEPEGQVSGERALALLHAFRHAGRQPVLLVGVRGDHQEPIRAGQRYDAILVAVQLANRSGPLNEIEWSEFVAALQHVSEQIPATCEIPDMRETTARARALDSACVPLDAQIGINLTSATNGWSGQDVADVARRLGLILRADGRFHALGDDGSTLFVLQNGDGGAFRADTLDVQRTTRLTLLLDVPRAPQAQQPFERLIGIANQLAQSLDAAIVDDQSRILSASALASIGRQIEPVYTKLIDAQMAAGSPRALALFG